MRANEFIIEHAVQDTPAGDGYWNKHSGKSATLWEDATNSPIVYHGNQGGIHRELITPMWWTESKQDAINYATQGGADGWVYSARLTCKNPYILKPTDETNTVLEKYKQLEKQGYDSIYDSSVGDWIPFYSKDIHLVGKPEYQEDDGNVSEGEVKSKSQRPTIGINVRSDGNIDYADLIVDGHKKYESRQTDSLRPYVGKTVAIVRTGKGPATAIGQADVGEPIIVNAEKFDKLRKQHRVPISSKFDILPNTIKYLYPMINPVRWDKEKLVTNKGIVARKIDEQVKSHEYFESQLESSDFLFEEKTTLSRLYGNDVPDDHEMIWNFVGNDDFDIPLDVEIMPNYKLKILLLSQYRVEHVDEIMDMLDDDQKDIVDHYTNDINLSKHVIVTSNNKIVDGNHRALAAAITNKPIKYVDLNELSS